MRGVAIVTLYFKGISQDLNSACGIAVPRFFVEHKFKMFLWNNGNGKGKYNGRRIKKSILRIVPHGNI